MENQKLKTGKGKGFSKGQYPLNRHGALLNRVGHNPLSSNARREDNFYKIDKQFNNIGRFRPTVHNISEI